MRICIVTHKFVKGDGQGRVNYEILKEAVKRDIQLELYATEVAEEFLRYPNVHWVQIPVKGWPTQLLKNQIFALISSVLLLFKRRHYDLVVMNGFITWLSSDINVVHFVHSSWIKSKVHPFRLRKNGFGVYQFLFTSLNSLLEKWAYSRARRLVPVSDKVKKELVAIGLADRPFEVIYNGVSLEEFQPMDAEHPITRESLGLHGTGLLALFVGDIKSPRKNLDSVLKAMQRVPDLLLAVVGADGESPYPTMAERLGLSKRVQFLGYRRDVADIMKTVDFFVFPSRYEACTLVVLEAMASGLPVITSYQSGVADLVSMSDRDGVTAGFVLEDSENRTDLANLMVFLSQDADMRKKMAEQARRVAEQFSWRIMAERYLNLFEQAVSEKDSRGVREMKTI
ncbi:glycosyltransferase family 4 protein [Gorillibacterium massiliense]|uniref:glycosyltransferase family 4 protein n=1 Tax=Gorillibacterium massiliense TaxID=1280390 RepID=UPI0004AC8FC6|nr:glycosyltransferase family 4 protein [Gorillibacterium massiliense]